MDPFIEGQAWRDFHFSYANEIRTALQAELQPRYVVRIEETVYMHRDDEVIVRRIAPDATIFQSDGWRDTADGGVAIALEPSLLTSPELDPVMEPYLVIRDRDGEEAITVIELLSPITKSSPEGRCEYLHKRHAILHSNTNLVELDLLRGGERLPTVERLPSGDYYVFITRVERRPQVEVYSWPLERTLPTLPIPLAEGDPDASLDLQAVFTTTYDRAGYDYSLKYARPLVPEISAARQAWVDGILRSNTRLA